MSEQTKLAIQNSKRSPAKVRQLGPEDLGLPVQNDGEQVIGWDTLQEKAENAAEDTAAAAVKTDDGTVRTGTHLHRGESHDVHPLELAIWKAYDDSASDIQNAVYAPNGSEYPCGRCLQVLDDYGSEDVVLAVLRDGSLEKSPLRYLEPREFEDPSEKRR